MPLQTWFNSIWYERKSPPWWLRPLSLAYGAAAASRRLLYAARLRRPVALAVPVIVVGNLSVGGTGKTPLVCWLTARLAEQGYRAGVATRGYGGSASGVRLIGPQDDPERVGDESVLLARRCGGPVAVGSDRPAAAQLLVDAGCNVIVSDDGLQHYALPRDCEIVVVDGVRLFGNGWLLPAGPLREPQSRLGAADAVVVNGGRAMLEGALAMRLDAGDAAALIGHARRPLDSFAGGAVHAVAGIGNPERFFNMLRAYGIAVTGHPLPDHARLQAADIHFDDALPVLMTEKDAVKCERFAGPQHWCVPVTAGFDGAQAGRLLDTVLRTIRKRA